MIGRLGRGRREFVAFGSEAEWARVEEVPEGVDSMSGVGFHSVTSSSISCYQRGRKFVSVRTIASMHVHSTARSVSGDFHH